MKIIFAGTPIFAVHALQALLASTHEVVAVYTQPDKPAGRGQRITESPVKALAKQHALPICQPTTLKTSTEQQALAAWQADVMVVAAYGMLLPAPVLHVPRLGCINIHPSLLPRWRGAAPIQRTVYTGDIKTGVTIMQMDEGLDTGPMLLQREYTLTSNETSQSLHDKLAIVGAAALLETLRLLEQGKLVATPQDNTQATYANKMTKEEALLDWTLSAIKLDQRIRAFNPWPVAYIPWQGETLRIWQAAIDTAKTNAVPGTIVQASRAGIDIATGEGVLRLLEVQCPGSKRVLVGDFYNAKRELLTEGSLLS